MTSPSYITPGSWLALFKDFNLYLILHSSVQITIQIVLAIYKTIEYPTPPSTTPAGTWFSISGTPMIRLNVSKKSTLPPPNSIEEGLRNFNISQIQQMDLL